MNFKPELEMKIITNLFKPNDWKPVYYTGGNWVDDGTVWEVCSYEILYSKSINEYKIKCYGYLPKFHTQYKMVVQVLNDLISKNEN